MNQTSVNVLKGLRKLYAKVFNIKKVTKSVYEGDANKASEIIYKKLIGDEPCMIGRFGSTELSAMVNHLGVKQTQKSIFKYIQGEGLQWWWSKSTLNQMQQWSGFFPPTEEKVEEFCELMLKDIKEVDVLGSWVESEKYFEAEMNCERIHLQFLEPFWANKPWSRALKGQKVLVIHPFAETILAQYEKRKFLFKNKDILPDFESLSVIKAVQTLGQASPEYADWFEALKSMTDKIDQIDFDICLIGAGAYGFPLAAHVKRIGKKGFHIGGALQLLFGIKGKRWEDPNYGVQQWGIPYGAYSSMMNDYWVRPGEMDKPKNANNVEGACYW